MTGTRHVLWSTDAARNRVWLLLVLAFSALFAVLATWLFLGAGRDDMFITLWAGEHVGARPWFVNFNFQMEEISSSILHTLVVAVLSWLGPEVVVVSNKLFGLLCSVALVATIFRFRSHLFGNVATGRPLALSAVALTVASPALAYWTMGGLETALQTLILLLYCIAFIQCARSERASLRDLGVLAGLQILYILVRSEGFWIVPVNAALFIPLLVRRGFQRRYSLAVLLPLAFAVGLIATRQYFTGLPFPNPTYAKIGSLRGAADVGVSYLLSYHSASGFARFHLVALGYAAFNLAVAARACLRRDADRIDGRLAVTVLSATAVASDLFAVLAGGNWMEYFRFMVPAIPIKNVLLVLLARDLFALARGRSWERAGRSVLALVSAGTVLLSFYQYLPHGINRRLNLRNQSTRLTLDLLMDGRGERLRRIVELNRPTRFTREATEAFIAGDMRRYLEASGHLTVVSHQAGYFPYLIRKHFSADEVEFIDSMGLVTKFVAVIPGNRTSFGVEAGTNLAQILANRAGRLSKEILAREPNMVYTGRMPDEAKATLVALGWQVVLEEERALILWRPAS